MPENYLVRSLAGSHALHGALPRTNVGGKAGTHMS